MIAAIPVWLIAKYGVLAAVLVGSVVLCRRFPDARKVVIKCGALVSLLLVTLILTDHFPNAATDPKTGMVLELPETIPGYRSFHREPGEKELYYLPEDTGILKRIYEPEEAKTPYEWIHATLILSGNDPRSLHRPEVCLEGQGWLIADKRPVTLDVNGQSLEVMDYSLERIEKRENGELVTILTHYYYWWIGKSRSTAFDWKRILYTDLDNLFRNVNNRWGYPSVMVQVDPNNPDRAQAHKDATDRAEWFIEQYAPMFQKSLAESAEPAPAAP